MERTFAWLFRSRRLVRAYEMLPACEMLPAAQLCRDHGSISTAATTGT